MPEKKGVCIVGCSDSKKDTPFHLDKDFEFWGVNNLYLSYADKPWTRWFEIHDIANVDGKWLRRLQLEFRGQPVEEYLKGLGKMKCPVYMQQPNPLVPTSVAFPLEEITGAFGDYFTNTISWEIALAIYEGFEEIRIYGVDMAVDTEYEKQRPSCEYFLGYAAGKGIKIVVPDSADLLKNRFLYGFEEQKAGAYLNKIEMAIKTVQTKRDEVEKELKFKQKQYDQYIGAELGLVEHLKTWKNVQGA